MPYDSRLQAETLLQAMSRLAAQGQVWVTSTKLAEASGASPAAVKRMLAKLLEQNHIATKGKARATRYRLQQGTAGVHNETAMQPIAAYRAIGPDWCAASMALKAQLDQPLGMRRPVTYRRDFVDRYQPNQTSLLPRDLADQLVASSRLPEQLPAGTYARKVLEQLLIDLSWSSSHLEGNHYSLLDTAELFKSGAQAVDSDAIMLLNHKAAIEFLVDAVPLQGLDTALVRNLHAVLMQDLLPDLGSLGTIREKVVNISGTTYVPTQVPALLLEMFTHIVGKAQAIKNPVEAAFFLWVNLAYLQPFEDGNKRVSRLAANVPLMLYNQAPLSFLDVAREDYVQAMLGVYEYCDVSMAVDLFVWTYRRSQAKYKVVAEAMGAPDPFRLQYRETLNAAVMMVVRERQSMAIVLATLGLPDADELRFRHLLAQELQGLAVFNCARYRLSLRETQIWIDAGRPN